MEQGSTSVKLSFFWRMFDRSQSLVDRPALGYFSAVLACLVASIARWSVDTWMPGVPFITYFPAIVGITFFFGTRAGIFCAILSIAATWYLFIEPRNSFGLSVQAGVALGVFALVVAFDIFLIHLTRAALQRLRQQQHVTDALYRQQRVMFQELQHRVANNLAFIGALLGYHERKASDTEGRNGFADARRRLESMGRLHRLLYDPEALGQPAQALLNKICANLEGTSDHTSIRVEADDIHLDLPAWTALGSLVSELLTNAIKNGGTAMHVSLMRTGPREVELAVSDNGPGLSPGFDPRRSQGLGMRIIEGLAGQLGGKTAFESEGGTTVRITFPFPR